MVLCEEEGFKENIMDLSRERVKEASGGNTEGSVPESVQGGVGRRADLCLDCRFWVRVSGWRRAGMGDEEMLLIQDCREINWL